MVGYSVPHPLSGQTLQATAEGPVPPPEPTREELEDPGSATGTDDAAAALGVLSNGVVIQRAGGEITYCNAAAERILGLSRDQMAGRTSLDPGWRAIHEDGSPFPGETHPAMDSLRTGEAVRGVVMGVHTPDGSLRWISVNADPIPGPDGRPASVVASFADISDRLRAEERYGALFREMLNGFALHEIVCDGSGKPVDYRFLAVNPAFERMTGLAARHIVGRTVLELMPGMETSWVESYGKVAVTGEPVHFESYAAELGKRFEVTAYQPAPRQLACVFADVTERRQAEEALRRSEERYRRIVDETHDGIWMIDAKSKELAGFSHSVSHDLRAPLRAIEGFSALIDALLTFTRTGRHGFRYRSLSMTPLVGSVLEEVAGGPEAMARVDFRLGELPDAEGDGGLIRQVWVNLLSNALKFSAQQERPVIEVSGSVEGHFSFYRVRDNGVGFDARHGGQLFGVFQRLHAEREFAGTGIGLALVKRIVERHGGRVWAEGEVGNGATFSFSLPVKSASHAWVATE